MAQSQQVPVPTALSSPVGHLMRPTLSCSDEDSVERAAGELRRNGGGILPIVVEGKLAGVLTETTLAIALGNGLSLFASCREATSEAFTIAPYQSGAEALRLLSEMDLPTLVVVDDADRVVGLISPSDLYPRRRHLPRPSPVGGMATPFGVYLTNGGLHGGVGLPAVMATGALMFTMLTTSIVLSAYGVSLLDRTSASEVLKGVLFNGAILALFLGMMRLAPLSGTHGAEHMVVHAIERGEELTPEVVSRMPRVHPRCGTNLSVAMGLFSGISFTPWVADPFIRTLVAALVTLFLWRPLGSFAQQYITTKKPNAKQLRSGIKAGTELIEKYSTHRFSSPGIPARIWNSGLLHVICGSTLTYLALEGVQRLFHFRLPGN